MECANPLLCFALLTVCTQTRAQAPCQSTTSSVLLSKCFRLSTRHLCPQSFFSNPSSSAALHAFFILFLSHSIINFNLRAGLNGTIREHSMLLIWMPAHLDLGIPHQRRKKITPFIIRQIHELARSHVHVNTRKLIQVIDQRPGCKRQKIFVPLQIVTNSIIKRHLPESCLL